MSLTSWFVIISLVFLLYTYLLNRNRSNRPPGPLRLPLIGSVWALGSNPLHTHVNITNLAKKWGPIYQVYFGRQPVVVITSPSIIQETFSGLSSPVLLRKITKTIFKATGGQSILFNTSRDHWAMLRKISAPLTKNMPGSAPIPHLVVAELSKLISHLEKDVGKEVYLNPHFMFFTRNVFYQIAWGSSWAFDTTDEEERNFNESMMIVMDNLNHPTDFFPGLDFLASRTGNIADYHATRIRNFILKIMAAREQDNRTEETARDLIDFMLLEKKNNPELSNFIIANTVKDILFAATLTTSDTLDWLIMYLCDHPDIQEKCYREIFAKLQGRMPNMEDKADLPYLEAVLKEILRLRPPAPVSLPHVADQNCIIGGYNISKGTVVLENLYGIGNWDEYFPNAASFDPDRWQRNPEKAINLLHFGYGPTMCLGMPVAKQELFLAAAALLQRFKFKFAFSTRPDFTGEFKTTFNAKPWNVVYSLRYYSRE